MTISKTHCRKEYTGNGATLVFPFDFYIGASSELLVYVDGVLKVVGVDYAISGVGSEAGGNVTFVIGSTPANNASIVILRYTAQVQATDLAAGGKFYEGDVEAMSDKITRLLQELQERLDRVPALTPSSSLGPLVLPTGAGKTLRWNGAGTALEAVSPDPGVGAVFTDVTVNGDILGDGDTGIKGIGDIIVKKPWADVRHASFAGGAKGDGITDDTVAIQAAIDYVGAAGGGVVYFPAGTYFLNTVHSANGVSWFLEVNADNITLAGDGPHSILKSTAVASVFFIGGSAKPAGAANWLANDFFFTPPTIYAINNATTPGLMSVTTTVAADAGNFSAGDIICLRCGQTITGGSEQPEAEINIVLASNPGTGVIDLVYPTAKPYIPRDYPPGHAQAGNPAPFGIVNVTGKVLRNITLRDFKIVNMGADTTLAGSQIMHYTIQNLVVETADWFQSQGTHRFMIAINNRITTTSAALCAALTAATGCSDTLWADNIIMGQSGTAYLHIHEASANVVVSKNLMMMKSSGVSSTPISIRSGAYNVNVLDNVIIVNGVIATIIFVDDSLYTGIAHSGSIIGNQMIAPNLTATGYGIRVSAGPDSSWKVHSNTDDLGWGTWVDEGEKIFNGYADSLWIPASSMQKGLFGSTPVYETVQNIWHGIKQADAITTNNAGFTFQLPRGWKHFQAYIWWVSKVAGAGNVFFTFGLADVAPGETLPTSMSAGGQLQKDVIAASPGQWVVVRSPAMTSPTFISTILPERWVTGQVCRLGTHASDTLVGDVLLLGVELRRVR